EIEDAGGEVAGLARGCRKAGAHQPLRLLFHHGDEPVPHDLQADRRQGIVDDHASSFSMTTVSSASTRALQPVGTPTVVSSSATSAGTRRALPGVRSLR